MDDKSMLKNINDAIKSHLPQATAGELKKYLEEAEADKKQKEILEVRVRDRDKTIKDKDALINEQREKISKFNEMGRTEEALDDRKLHMDDRERNFELELLKEKLQSERNNKSEIRDVVRDVFKSPVYRKNIEKMIPVEQTTYDSQYNSQTSMQESRPNGSYITQEAQVENIITTEE